MYYALFKQCTSQYVSDDGEHAEENSDNSTGRSNDMIESIDDDDRKQIDFDAVD